MDPAAFRNNQRKDRWEITADHIDEMLAAMFATESKSKQLAEAVKRCHELGASKEEIAEAVFG